MRGSEFLRKLRRYARQRGLEIEIVSGHGKGSHVRVYLGTAFATLKDRNKEVGPGLLRDMCRQLGVDPKDLE